MRVKVTKVLGWKSFSRRINHLDSEKLVKEHAYLSLGSNLGDRIAHLRTAIEQLARVGTMTAVSGFYEAEPVELEQQPWFLNCVIQFDTDQSPQSLLKIILTIEQQMGRVRLKDKGPRVIDIDIVLFGDRTIDEPGLKIPHPAMQRRRFVLEPLAEIAPEVKHSLRHRSVVELLADLGPGQIVRRLQINPSK